MIIKKIPTTKKVLSYKVEKNDKNEVRLIQQVQTSHPLKPLKIYGLGEILFANFDSIDVLVKHVEVKINTINKLKEKYKYYYEIISKRPANQEEQLLNWFNLNSESVQLSEEIIDEIVLNVVSVPIMICCILETFVNKMIFNNSLFIKPHYEVQRYIPLEVKLFKIIPEIANKKDYFKSSTFKTSYKQVIEIRNNIVHQKSTTKESEETTELIKKLLETDWDLIFRDVKKIIKDFHFETYS